MKRINPLTQMTLALVALTVTLVMLADLFFGVLPDRAAEQQRLRKQIGESLGVQVAAMMEHDERIALDRTLKQVLERNPQLRSLAIRRADGQIVMQAGDHARSWVSTRGEQSDLQQVSVPLNAAGDRWGQFELAFRPDEGNALWNWLTQPLMLMVLFLSTIGALVFGLYMRRALQHLDPASVIPDRVQGAFDAMGEGVVVLDARGRVLLTNRAFRALHRDCAEVHSGSALSSASWLATDLPDDPATHPWARAMAEHVANAGFTLEIGRGTRESRQLIINCAPIADPGGAVRGCLTTFTDVTDLHQANLQLRETLAKLELSQGEIEHKNEELQRLASRDPLTGCLNRRAFHEQFEPLFAGSRPNKLALSCLMIDIDHFKAVNDNHGHAIGDRVIQEVARKLNESARATDLVCRYGGEEFCVVVPGMNVAETRALAERIRQRVERECGAGVRDVADLRVTVSVGVHTLGAGATSPAALIDRADQALYRAKRSGRNRVSMFAGPMSAAAAGDSPPPAKTDE
jgi:diguanylate cyclase (GGDEF)-like protein